MLQTGVSVEITTESCKHLHWMYVSRIVKDTQFLHVENEDSAQTARISTSIGASGLGAVGGGGEGAGGVASCHCMSLHVCPGENFIFRVMCLLGCFRDVKVNNTHKLKIIVIVIVNVVIDKPN